MTQITKILGLVLLSFSAGVVSASAQRADGCLANGVSTVSDVARDRFISGAGYSLSESSLLSALRDRDPSVRSLAALKLATLDQNTSITLLTRAWSAEQDHCTQGHIGMAIGQLLLRYWTADPVPGRRMASLEFCRPSSPEIVSLRLEQISPPEADDSRGPTIRLTARNQTSETIPFLSPMVNPLQLFSVAVLDPTRQPTKEACSYERCEPKSGPTRPTDFISGVGPPFFIALPPQKDVSWTWKIGRDFDMSAPGIYSVRIGAAVGYLSSTVCSNTALVAVK